MADLPIPEGVIEGYLLTESEIGMADDHSALGIFERKTMYVLILSSLHWLYDLRVRALGARSIFGCSRFLGCFTRLL